MAQYLGRLDLYHTTTDDEGDLQTVTTTLTLALVVDATHDAEAVGRLTPVLHQALLAATERRAAEN